MDDLEKTFASVQAAKSEVTTRVVTQDNADTKLVQTLTQLAGYVESVAEKNDALITSAAKTPREPHLPVAFRTV